MRPVMWQMMTSLDGRFEGPDGDLDWHVVDGAFTDYVLDMLDSTDTILFGRRTYEALAGYWPTATSPEASRMNTLPKIVFSHSLDRADWQNTRLVTTAAVDEVRRLRGEGDGAGGTLSLFGSGALAGSLMQAGLIDEVRILLCPVVLGGGPVLLEGMPARTTLTLNDVKRLASGVLILSYHTQAPG